MNHLLRPRAPLFTRVAAGAILAASISVLTARADITGFDAANFSLNGNQDAINAGVPNITAGVLNLTTQANSQASSTFFNTPQAVDNFTASFTYDFLNGSGNPADGFAFVLQNAGLNALGGGGGAIGYEGIGQSVAIKFNLYNADGLGYGFNGVGPIPTGPTILQLTGANPIDVRMDYNGSLLQTVLKDSVTGATERRTFEIGDISSIVGDDTAFVGFTGGTGGESAAQAISNFSFTIGTGVVSPFGFNVRQVRLNTAAEGGNTANSGGGTIPLQLENITEGESLLNGTDGFLANGEGSAIYDLINNPFPIGGGDQFAISGEGYVDLNGDGYDGDNGTYSLYVDSDDGFRLRLNDVVIGEFAGPTGASNTIIPDVALKDGDKLTVTFFELGGGEKLVFKVGDTNGAFVGTEESGISIRPDPVPEPGTATLLALGVLGLAMRRRRA